MPQKLVTMAEVQRNEGDKWERVIAIGPGTGDIDVFVDRDGHVLQHMPWNYKFVPFETMLWIYLE